MSPSSPRHRLTTLAGVVAAALGTLVVAAGPAAAHTEVSAQPAQAGATDAVLTFTAEAESTTAGITSLRVLLPTGITPPTVSYVSGPPGWALTATTDGYTVAGPALPADDDAQYQVKIAKLPAETTVVFKTLQTYSDGRVDRWIDLATPGAPEPEHPAPVLNLAPAPAAAASAAAQQPATPTPAATPSATPPPTGPAADSDDGGVHAGLWVPVAVGAVAGVGAVIWLGRRRASTGPR